MAKFFVGQRVKITGCRHPSNSHYIGKGGTLTEFAEGVLTRGWIVDVDGIGLTSEVDDYGHFFEEQNLTPASDSNQLSSWESMKDIWVPDEMRAGA